MTTQHNFGPVGILAPTTADLPDPRLLPLGNYFFSETDGKTYFVARDGTGQHIWKQVMGAGAGGSAIVWPLGVPWSSIAALLAAAGDAALLLVEGDPTGAPRLMTGAVGVPYDFSFVIFIGAASDRTNNVTVQMDVNVKVDPPVLRSRDIMWAPTAPDLFDGPADPAFEVDLDGGGVTPPGPIGGRSVFFAPSGYSPHNFRLRNGAILDGTNLAATDEGICRLRPSVSDEVLVTVESYGGIFGPKSFINFVPPVIPPFPPFPVPTTAVVEANMDAKTRIDPGYNAVAVGGSNVAVRYQDGSSVPLNLPDPAKRDVSSYVAYDDALVMPPLGVGNVQDAIDVLKNSAPDLEAVLAVGNKSGPHDVLMQAGQAVDTDGAAQLSLGTGNATSIAMGRPLGGAADLQVFINQGGAAFISNAGIQYSSTFANRAQIRLNAFGDHGGVAGVTAFKSRGATVTAKASVLAGDPIYRVTVIGVTGDNDKTPVAGYIDLSVAPAGVQPLYVASQYAVSLVPLEGPINSIQEMWKITSQGVPCLREEFHQGPNGDSVTVVAGVIALGLGGVVNVLNPNIKANTRFTLTIQDGGAVPLGSVYVASRVVGPGGSFNIQSTNAADVDVLVYWQLWEQVVR